MTFEDIRITRLAEEDVGSPSNDGTAGSALYAVPFELSGKPTREWAALFVDAWDRPARFSTMHRPGIARVESVSNRIILNGTTLEEVRDTHRETLVWAVERANAQYREALRKKEEREQRAQAREEQHREHVADVAKDITFD